MVTTAAAEPKAAAPVVQKKEAQKEVTAPLTKAPPRPDQKAFDTKYNQLQTEIEQLKAQVQKIRDVISGNSDGKTQQVSERQELLDKIQKLKEEQDAHKAARETVFEQMKAGQEALKKKLTDVKNSKEKMPFKSTDEIDRKITYVSTFVIKF